MQKWGKEKFNQDNTAQSTQVRHANCGFVEKSMSFL